MSTVIWPETDNQPSVKPTNGGQKLIFCCGYKNFTVQYPICNTLSFNKHGIYENFRGSVPVNTSIHNRQVTITI